ncbi:MAG: nucleotidyltransferase domain-containing protein [Phycisphaeraceae bacterium]|nr:nucleotidyltransferase domain-containing protein [Phycisphaeraceae bacterium]
MIDCIAQHRSEIHSICRSHGVRRLELFGSAARDDFDPALSDIDFFVEFLSYDNPAIADHWFGLQEDLQTLLRRRVDLTSLRAAKNPYFLEVANRDRISLYAA